MLQGVSHHESKICCCNQKEELESGVTQMHKMPHHTSRRCPGFSRYKSLHRINNNFPVVGNSKISAIFDSKGEIIFSPRQMATYHLPGSCRFFRSVSGYLDRMDFGLENGPGMSFTNNRRNYTSGRGNALPPDIENTPNSNLSASQQQEGTSSGSFLLRILESRLKDKHGIQLSQFKTLSVQDQVSLMAHSWRDFEKQFSSTGKGPWNSELKILVATALNITKSHLNRILQRASRMQRLHSSLTRREQSITPQDLQYIRETVQEYLQQSRSRNVSELYSQMMKVTGLTRDAVRYFSNQYMEKLSRVKADKIRENKKWIQERVSLWINEHGDDAPKSSLYSQMEQELGLSRVQAREVVRNVLLRMQEDDVTTRNSHSTAGEHEHREIILHILNEHPDEPLSSLYEEIKERTGLTKRLIFRIYESLQAEMKTVTDEHRDIVREELDRYEEEMTTARGDSVHDMDGLSLENSKSQQDSIGMHTELHTSHLYSRIHDRTQLTRVQIRRLVANARLKKMRQMHSENRTYIQECLQQYTKSQQPMSDLYDHLQESLGLSRDRVRELVHQEKQKFQHITLSPSQRKKIQQLVIEFDKESKETDRSDTRSSSALYSLIEQEMQIPRSQIRDVVRGERQKIRRAEMKVRRQQGIAENDDSV